MMPSAISPERPIYRGIDDKLDRSRFIERLVGALVDPNTNKSTGVVIGITGPWGSGKSSILNLLHEQIQKKYNDALVVRFDPWLVSGRNDLIGEFLGELIGTINADQNNVRKLKRFGDTLAEYGAQLAPLGDLVAPGIGRIFSASFSAMKKALSDKASLSTLRAKLIKELEELSVPIIVLIDEIDRVEDDEIRAVAQLVRSVVDFPGISYILAYDPERVIQALGASIPAENKNSAESQHDRGKAYLEKIVQLQIPLPVTFDDEVKRLLTADLNELQSELGLPNNFQNTKRYQELMEIISGNIIRTLRDIRRLAGTFHVLKGMLGDEVDWIDLLAYSTLAIKAPGTVAHMRRKPDDYLDAHSSDRYSKLDEQYIEERFKELIPFSEQADGTKKLLAFIFPSFSEYYEEHFDHPDAIYQRRPLLTTLRLGLLPGAFSRDQIEALVANPLEKITKILRENYDQENLGHLIDRLDDLYVELCSMNHITFWQGVGAFLKKPDCAWMQSYNPMFEIVRRFAGILEQAVRKNGELRTSANALFDALLNAGESELTAHWLRRHFFAFGLFGCEKRGGDSWFLDSGQTETIAYKMAERWRTEHLAGKLIPCRWDLLPIYIMLDTDLWDSGCRDTLDHMLNDHRALDCFTLMLFGGNYSSEMSTISKMCNHDAYIERLKTRLDSAIDSNLHETVRIAMQKALGQA